MKKTYSVLLLVSLLTILLLTGCSSKGISGKEDEVRISLYGEVAPASAVISKEKDSIVVDPKKVTSLYISNPANSDLIPLKYFTNLKYLRIDDFFTEKKYDTYDLSPLKDLPLVGLDISGMDSTKPMSIKSLEPIGNIKSLAILNLEHCQVTSVKDLAELTSLSSLYIKDASDIKIEDLSSLSGLINMEEMSDIIEESKEWKFGPYILSEDEPLLGLTISNGNSEEEIEALRSAIFDNKRGLDQVSTKEDDTDIYYFIEYSTHKFDSNNNEALVNVFLEAFDKKGEPA
ncbi:MAG: hypothetical protein GX076_03900, partial [Clostridiales bacterium]|nr:hypothetical protein [Clostridiales bacterium]